jgi:MYXO-CTERM domain-containing protein
VVIAFGSPVWLLLGQAHAVELEELVEAWTDQRDGGLLGPDAALGTAVGSGGEVVAVGYLSQLAENGTDGYAVAYQPDGTVIWEIVQDVGPVGTDRTSSEDLLYAVSIDPLVDQMLLCGAQGANDLDDPDRRYLVEAWDPAFPTATPLRDWVQAYVDGNPSTSLVQECRGAQWLAGHVYAAGWADHDDDEGRWVSFQFDETDGTVLLPLFYESAAFAAVPDQALDLSVNSATSEIAVVGARGFAGLDGSLLNDTDWHVRYHDGSGQLLWEDTYAGVSQLDDQALAAVAETATGDLYVVGHTNAGADNAEQANFDWLVMRYDGDGDGAGNPVRVWTHTWESVPGASEGATAIALDELGDVLVGGYAIDPGTGTEQWRVAKLAAYDGLLLEEWLGPVQAGDSRVTALEFRSGVLSVVGTISDGEQIDFAVTKIEGDLDEDGVADSVDACPDDPDKAENEGICGCNVPDIDTDADGFENCIEECSSNPDKQEPGVCGCEEPDTDTDGDLTFDCDDRCPNDPNKAADVGICGCDNPDTDTDGDGVVGCKDACSNTPPDTVVDTFGCPIEDGIEETGDTGGEVVTDGKSGGCGCSSSGTISSGVGVLAALVLAGRRRSRQKRL